MLIWKIFGTLFIISVVVAAICAVCKLVVSLETLRDRTNTLADIAVRNEAKINTLADKISQTKDDLRLLNDYQNVTAQTVTEDRAEISALHDHFDDLEDSASTEIAALHDRFDDLEEKIKANSVRISALADLYEDLLKRIENLEKGGAQIERKTGRAKSEG